MAMFEDRVDFYSIDGKKYLDGSKVEFVTYTYYDNGFLVDPTQYKTRIIKKGTLRFDYKSKVTKSIFNWKKVGQGEKEWFITDVTNIKDGTRDHDYLLSETNILNENKIIDNTKKHNILVLENESVRIQKEKEQRDAEREIATQNRLDYETREATEELERYRQGGTRKRKRKNRKTKRIVWNQ